MRIVNGVITLATVGLLVNCAGTNKRSNEPSPAVTSKPSTSNDDAVAEVLESGGVSGTSRIMSFSLSNSPLSSKQFSRSKARDEANKLVREIKRSKGNTQKEHVALMTMQRMAGNDLNTAFETAKRIALNEMKIDIGRAMPEAAILELALSSIISANYSMADYWLNELLSSKDKKMRAAERTARGIIELRSGRLPEAVFNWNEALKFYQNYEPARLNIGFFALKYGDFQTAKKMLSPLKNDYFTMTGLMQAERLADRSKKVDSMCEQILKSSPKYKPALFSCALNTYQGLGDLAKARTQLEKVAQVEGPPVEIDEKSFLTIGKIEAALKNSAPAKPAK